MHSRRFFCLLVWPALWVADVMTGFAQPLQVPSRGGFESGGSRGSWVQMEGGTMVDEDAIRTAREAVSHSTGTPEWTNPKGFERDVFTFARVVFKNDMRFRDGEGYGRGPRFGWWVDFPDADLNFSYRLQELTSTKVDPDGRVLKLTDPTLPDYPIIYVEHPGYMMLSTDEQENMRKYLLNGGVLFVNDFWSSREWDGFEAAMRQVLPGRTWTELTTDHPLFNCVYKLNVPMQRLQVPTMQFWNEDFDPNDPTSRLQRRPRGEGSDQMHVRAWLDDKGRIMILAIHNSDVSDGWEREGEQHNYFQTFSEKVSYPLGINIIFYVMTH